MNQIAERLLDEFKEMRRRLLTSAGMVRPEWILAVQSISATAALTLLAPQTAVLVDTTSGSVTLTLPAAGTVTGARLEVKKMVAANTLTLDGNASETIDGAATLAWTTQYQSYSLISTGTTWVIV
jgi:hypothetical protein